MACYRPVLVAIHEGAKRNMPCGRCVGCDLERSRQWAVRCMHEASLSDENCLITLTYAPEHLPVAGSLDRRAFPLFMKRLRKRIEPRRVRYFMAGEYGDRNGRPHYHSLLFGYDFPDKVPYTRRGEYQVWESPLLASLWEFGRSEIGTVTFESAAYVARYILKKVRGRDAQSLGEQLATYRAVDERYPGDVFFREPEFATMSRRPGIGKGWFDRFVDDVYVHDELIMRGKRMRPPRYYDKLLAASDPTRAEAVCFARARREVDYEELTPRRLAVREDVAEARVNLQTRSCE